MDFQPISEERPARLVLSVTGKGRTGKNHFALTAPGDTCVHSWDPNLEAVGAKFARRAREQKRKPPVACRYNLPVLGSGTPEELQAIAGPEWGRFRRNYESSLRDYRNVIVDTGTNCWEHLRFASFGRASMTQQAYGPLNAEMTELVKMALEPGARCNVFWIHHMSEVMKAQVDGSGKTTWLPTGEWRQDGCRKMPNIVQAELLCYRQKDGDGAETGSHVVKILNSTDNPDIEGMELIEPECSFLDVAALMLPKISAEAWQ